MVPKAEEDNAQNTQSKYPCNEKKKKESHKSELIRRTGDREAMIVDVCNRPGT